MAKKKTAARKKKPAARKKPAAGKKPAARKKAPKSRRKTARPRKIARLLRTKRQSSPVESLYVASPSRRRGLGAHSAGQSGDTQGLSNMEEAGSESVEELAEEGQNFEADAVGGVEEADGSQDEVHTRQVLEDDVPLEYLENDMERLTPRSPSPKPRR